LLILDTVFDMMKPTINHQRSI